MDRAFDEFVAGIGEVAFQAEKGQFALVAGDCNATDRGAMLKFLTREPQCLAFGGQTDCQVQFSDDDSPTCKTGPQ